MGRARAWGAGDGSEGGGEPDARRASFVHTSRRAGLAPRGGVAQVPVRAGLCPRLAVGWRSPARRGPKPSRLPVGGGRGRWRKGGGPGAGRARGWPGSGDRRARPLARTAGTYCRHVLPPGDCRQGTAARGLPPGDCRRGDCRHRDCRQRLPLAGTRWPAPTPGTDGRHRRPAPTACTDGRHRPSGTRASRGQESQEPRQPDNVRKRNEAAVHEVRQSGVAWRHDVTPRNRGTAESFRLGVHPGQRGGPPQRGPAHRGR